MYQLYYRFTDTKRTFPPLFNEFFFRRCLIPLIAICRGTFDTSAQISEESKVKTEGPKCSSGKPQQKRRNPGCGVLCIGFSKNKPFLNPAKARYFAGSGVSPA